MTPPARVPDDSKDHGCPSAVPCMANEICVPYTVNGPLPVLWLVLLVPVQVERLSVHTAAVPSSRRVISAASISKRTPPEPDWLTIATGNDLPSIVANGYSPTKDVGAPSSGLPVPEHDAVSNATGNRRVMACMTARPIHLIRAYG